MNFFEEQRKAKKKSRELYQTFIIVLILVSVVSGFVLKFLTYFFMGTMAPAYSRASFWSMFLQEDNLVRILGLSALIGAIIFVISSFKMMSLKSSPSAICESLGASKIARDPIDNREKQYRNIVEEMSIASSVPVPSIYILNDPAINAFACGFDINSAAICVTTGALVDLSRDELQSVIAHEYSHILNGDMPINLKLIGMLAGVFSLYYIGRIAVRSQRRGRKGNGKVVLLGFVVMGIGMIGYIIGNLLKGAISRQREYLADASSVQFTRNPAGMVGALKKIVVNSQQGLLKSPNADELSHLFLVEGVKANFFSVATHPDIHDRIKSIDKNYDRKYFLREGYKEIEASLIRQRRAAANAPREETKKSDPKKQIETLMPLFLLYEKSKKKLDLSQSELLRRFVANKDPEIRVLSPLKKLEILEVIFEQIKNADSDEKNKMYEILKREIKKDAKIDYDELMIYLYLYPALVDVDISLARLSHRNFKRFANYVLNFLHQLDDNVISEERNQKLSEYVSFKLVEPFEIKHTILLKVFQRLRFCNINQKEKLLKACDLMISHNGRKNEKEEVTLKIIKQIVAVPGKSD